MNCHNTSCCHLVSSSARVDLTSLLRSSLVYQASSSVKVMFNFIHHHSSSIILPSFVFALLKITRKQDEDVNSVRQAHLENIQTHFRLSLDTFCTILNQGFYECCRNFFLVFQYIFVPSWNIFQQYICNIFWDSRMFSEFLNVSYFALCFSAILKTIWIFLVSLSGFLKKNRKENLKLGTKILEKLRGSS